MNFLPEEFDEILNIYREESEEIVQKFNSNLIRLEENPEDSQILTNLFQEAHSLKGSARMLGFYNIQNISHKIEDILALIRDKKLSITQSIFDKLYKTVDFLSFLINNSVNIKQDYNCDSIDDYLNDLDAITGNTELTNKEQPKELKKSSFSDVELENFLKQIPNINALVLESLYILNRYDEKEKETLISILSDNFINLHEIFKVTNFSDLNEKIESLKSIFNIKVNVANSVDAQEVEKYKELISEIVQGINIIFSHLSIPSINNELIQEQDSDVDSISSKEPSDDIDEFKIQLREKLDYLSSNISQIKTDSGYIENSQKYVLSLLNCNLGEDITKIYKKIFEILQQIKKLGIKPENDIITILTQSINITKKIILNTDTSEEEDLSLLFQRLSIVEQMIDISEIANPGHFLDTSEKQNIEPEFQKVQEFFKTFEIGTIKTLRVDTKKLDTLIVQTGELIINGIKNQKHLSELDKFNNKLFEWGSVFKKTMNYIKYYDKKTMGRFDGNEAISAFNKQLINIFQDNLNGINELIQDVNELYKQIHEDDVKLNHIILEIENVVKSIRVLPLATVFHMLPRMVRDIAANNQKEVELLISGSETTVDKKIIEEIKMPLIHILRNSIDHGIELPEDRIKNNKPRVGKIHLSAKYEENKIIIEIEDDGLGINLKKVKEKALQKGLLTNEEIDSMNDEQIMNLIFWPGFSTGDKITEISGRGIGLDIVQTKISQLNGKVKMYSMINQGAKVIIELPISMSTVKSFIVTIEDQNFAIPMNAIKIVQWLNEDKIFFKDGYKSVLIDNQTIPVFDLADVLGIKRKINEIKKNITIVVVEAENNKVAYIVDKLLGDQEIIHKKLSPPIFKLKNIGGITTLASGDLCLIINISELLKNSLPNVDKLSVIENKLLTKKKNAFDPKKHKILIIDDSKITLTLLDKIVSKAGYQVVSYQDPVSALEKLKLDSLDLIISDIEMPKMNGYELVKHVKNNEALNKIPIIIISTMQTPQIKDLFKDLKINNYINKLKFEKNDLLNKISNVIQKTNKAKRLS